MSFFQTYYFQRFSTDFAVIRRSPGNAEWGFVIVWDRFKSFKLSIPNNTAVDESSSEIPWKFAGNHPPVSFFSSFRLERKSQPTPHCRPGKSIIPWTLCKLILFTLPLQFHRILRLCFPTGYRTGPEVSQPIFWRDRIRLYGFAGCAQQNENRIGAIEQF